MKSFTDTKSKQWNLQLTLGDFKRVKDMLEVNLLDLVVGDLLSELEADMSLTVDILYVLCKPIADEANITDEEFAMRLSGDTFEEATTAMLGAIADALPKAKRKILHAMLEKAEGFRNAIETRALETMESLNVEEMLSPLESAGDDAGNGEELSE